MNTMVEPRSHEDTKVLEPELKTARSKAEPELRFAEFCDDWERKSLSQVCEMKAGKFVRASDISEVKDDVMYPCYGGNGLRGYTRTKTHYGQYPLIGRQGALCGNVQLANGEFHATEHAVVVNSNEENDSIWLYYQLDKLNLNRFATGQAQPGLSVDVIQKVKAFFPLHAEQQKIADFLSSVDKKIEQLTEKHRLLTEYKKGVMQQIFTQQIRFKDTNGNDYPDWEEKKLGELVKLVGGYAFNSTLFSDAGVPIIRISNIKTNFAIDLTDVVYYPNNLITASLAKYAVNTGDVLIAMSGATTGKVGKYNESQTSILNQRVGKFVSIKDTSDLGFIFQFLKTEYFQNEVLSNSPGGAQPNISGKDIERVKHSFPNFSEQQKIAYFLTEIDQKIDQAWSTLEQTKAFKKGLLQKMFV